METLTHGYDKFRRIISSLIFMFLVLAFVGVFTLLVPLNIALLLSFLLLLIFIVPLSIETYQVGWRHNLISRNIDAIAKHQVLSWVLGTISVAIVLSTAWAAWTTLSLWRLIFG